MRKSDRPLNLRRQSIIRWVLIDLDRTHCVADERICFKLPSDLDFPAASTVPLAANTAWLALLSKDCLNIPRGSLKGISVLVWGGSCKSLQILEQVRSRTLTPPFCKPLSVITPSNWRASSV